MDILAVSIGAIGGAVSRYSITSFAQKRGWTPYSTMAINMTGSFILGALVARQPSCNIMLLFGSGYCGAFTTFSTFSVDTVLLFEKGLTGRAAFYIVGTNLLSIGGAALGYKLFRIKPKATTAQPPHIIPTPPSLANPPPSTKTIIVPPEKL